VQERGRVLGGDNRADVGRTGAFVLLKDGVAELVAHALELRVLGGLVGLGISEPNAKAFEAALRDGGIVLGVAPHDDTELTEIKKEFERLHGENVYVTSV